MGPPSKYHNSSNRSQNSSKILLGFHYVKPGRIQESILPELQRVRQLIDAGCITAKNAREYTKKQTVYSIPDSTSGKILDDQRLHIHRDRVAAH
jgi:hypothetical protein